MLRVTSGSLKGLKIDVPRAEAVRPPLEMARQAIFNILGQDIEGWRVVDLFAGSGIMGIEALSRGAEFALFVEKERASSAVISANLEKARMSKKSQVVSADAFATARYLRGVKGIDAVFLDPPFAMIRSAQSLERVKGLIDALFESPALKTEAIVVLRIPGEVPFEWSPPQGQTGLAAPVAEGAPAAPVAEAAPAAPAGRPAIVIIDERKYGHSRVLFFARAGVYEGE